MKFIEWQSKLLVENLLAGSGQNYKYANLIVKKH
jgi:hypothetical protein